MSWGTSRKFRYIGEPSLLQACVPEKRQGHNPGRLVNAWLVKWKPLRHHLLEFYRLLGGIDFDQRLFRRADLDPVPAFHGPEHLQFFGLLEFAGRRRTKPLKECGGIRVQPEMNEHRNLGRKFGVEG